MEAKENRLVTDGTGPTPVPSEGTPVGNPSDARPTIEGEPCIECCLQEVGDTVQRMVRVFQLFERDQITVFGFTSSQCYCLLEIFKADGLTMNELSDKMNLNTSTMTRVVDKLVRDGYITRSRDEEDRRIVFVRLTAKGEESAVKLNESINEYYRKIINHLPDGRVEEVLGAVSLLINAFEKANPHCC